MLVNYVVKEMPMDLGLWSCLFYLDIARMKVDIYVLVLQNIFIIMIICLKVLLVHCYAVTFSYSSIKLFPSLQMASLLAFSKTCFY